MLSTEAPPRTPETAIPWASRARRFAANLRALTRRTDCGAKLVRAAVDYLPRYELHRTADGNFQVRDLHPESPAAQWLGGLTDHRADTALLKFDRNAAPLPNPILFDGLGFGWLFLHVLNATRNSFLNYSCAVYVLETDPLALAMLFHMHDLQEAIEDPRVRWFIGSTAAEILAAWRSAMDADSAWTPPHQVIHSPLRQRPPLPCEDPMRDLLAARARRRDALVAQSRAFYADKNAAFWHDRYRNTAGLRVLGITSRYTTVLQHSMRELQAAIEAAGSEMRIAIEPDDHSLENPFAAMITDFQPDLIVQISRLRYENPHLPGNVPFLCWDQDNLSCMRTPAATAALDALTYVAGHAALFGYTNLRWNRRNCIFCHPAGATFRYHDRPAAKELHARHACDISYVSNASGSPESLAAQLRDRWTNQPFWPAVFDRIAAVLLADSAAGANFDYVDLRNRVRTAASGLKGFNDPLCHEMAMDLLRLADRAYRHTTLAWVSRWCAARDRSLRLYGRGWESHPQFARWACGSAEPGEDTRAIYRASKINLQLIEPGFIHSRSLDGLAAGGFFLTRHTSVDGVGSPDVAALYDLARYVKAQGIAADAQLQAVADPAIQAKVASVRDYYLRHQVTEPLCPSLHVWAETPAAAMVFPQLPDITFRDQSSFAELADRYLSDDTLRRTLAADMRRIVLDRFSYAARWRTFRQAIQEGLAAAHSGA